MQLRMGLEALLPGLRVRVLKPPCHTRAFSSSSRSHSELMLPSLCQGQGQVVYKQNKTQCLSRGSFPASRAHRQMWLMAMACCMGLCNLGCWLWGLSSGLRATHLLLASAIPASSALSPACRFSASARDKSQPLAGTLQHYY